MVEHREPPLFDISGLSSERITMKLDDDYEFQFTISSKASFDEQENRDCLDIFDNISNKITRHYYEYVDKEILRNMPISKLLDLRNKVRSELAKRDSSQS